MSSPYAPTAAEQEECLATRRDVHRHPELKYEEHRTAALVAERLRSLGYEPRTGVGGTGVTAVTEGRAPGPTVLLRADMDALPIEEQNEVPYRSEASGRMHACGHDCHVAVALAAARVLRRLPPARGRVKLCFQPAEEGGNGAKAMIDDGVLDDPAVDAVFGLHVWNHLPVGKVAVTPGPFMGAIDRFRVRVVGQGGHGAVPNESRDPVLAAAHVITALQQIVSRNVDPLEGAVVTVGRVRGGDAFNVIPDAVELEGTMRSFSSSVWAALPGHLERAATRTAEAYGCRAEVEVDRLMRATVNAPEMADLVREVAAGVVGGDNVVSLRTFTSEDFSEFLERRPGCFFFVGSRNESLGRVHPHHSPRFDVDESVLPLATELLVGVARRYLEA